MNMKGKKPGLIYTIYLKSFPVRFVLLYNPDENYEMSMSCKPAYIAILFFILKELDTFLAFSPEYLSFPTFHKHIKRLEHDILIHSMPFCQELETSNLTKKRWDHNNTRHTLRSRSLSLHQFIHRKNRILLPCILNLHQS